MSPDNEETTPTTPATEVTEATEISTPTVTEETVIEDAEMRPLQEGESPVTTPVELIGVQTEKVEIAPGWPNSTVVEVPAGTPVVEGAYTPDPDHVEQGDIEVQDTITLGGQEINPDDLTDAQIQGVLSGGAAGLVASASALAPVSGFAALKTGLPPDHWIFEKNAAATQPQLNLTRTQSDTLRHCLVQAVQQAVREGTNYGAASNFDPDALVQRVVWAFYNPDAIKSLELPEGEDGVVPSDEISTPPSQEEQLVALVTQRLANKTGFKPEMSILSEAIRQDHGYAWSWHCNLAVAILDTHIPHPRANRAAAEIMARVFKIDTTTFPEYADTQLEAPKN